MSNAIDQKTAKGPRSDKSRKEASAVALKAALKWLIDNKRLRRDRNFENKFAAICGGGQNATLELRTMRRWLDGKSIPQKANWTIAINGLREAGLDPLLLQKLEEIWSGSSPSNETSANNILCDTEFPNVTINPNNPFPRMCFINLEVPEQGSSPEDFFIIGELRFARTSDMVDGKEVLIGVKKAALLPIPKNCRLKIGSLYRPVRHGLSEAEGAAQVIFQADQGDTNSILQGDQLKGETLGRFVAINRGGAKFPELDVEVHIESPSDLHVEFANKLPSRSLAQRKLAEKWITDQIAHSLKEHDGTFRIASCSIRWG